MIRFKSGVTPFVIQQYYDALTTQGIPCVVRNQFISGAMGELPAQDLEPELWLINADDLVFAERVLTSLKEDNNAEAWICSTCQEPQDAEFNLCWNCQSPKC
ncbi:MAG: DUF2007 domain-containing protein [Pseudomonadota bacterium]|uniref:DUF2007 domain-containing protein n=1 Tax=Alteromonas alba TaxID=2079529 RepID=A0A2S9V4Z3_9ALTE|nr:DUF2007 domain-containing protein [Alteromonas alba]MCP4863019.1 DUF2007 domain-containing protein [Alteromonas sp.]MDY6925498.1 DUF2007 domain-containing protein [Pseudomonadota bacterium]PRO71474.1 hypothetical protein C6Y40_21250 [Alteromonas alba]